MSDPAIVGDYVGARTTWTSVLELPDGDYINQKELVTAGGRTREYMWDGVEWVSGEGAGLDALSRLGTNSMEAPLKLAFGTQALPGLTFDADTNTGMFHVGSDKIAFVVGGVIHEVYDVNKQPKGGYSPIDGLAVGNGVTTDDAVIDAMITRIKADVTVFGASSNFGRGLELNLQGRAYALKDSHTIDGLDGLMVRNGLILVVAGGTLAASPGTPVFSTTLTARNTRFSRLVMDMGKVAAGISLGGSGSNVDYCVLTHFKAYGVHMPPDLGAERSVSHCLISEWGNGDAEFANQANYTADGVRVADNDCIVGPGNIIRWSGCNIRSTADAQTLMIFDTHVYNGGSGVLTKVRPKNIIVEEGGGGVSINGCYIDNGECDFFSPSVSMNGNKALHNPGNSTLNYLVAVYPPPSGTSSGPYQFRATNWQPVSSTLIDGTVPIVDFPPHPDTANAWTGDFAKFRDMAAANKWCIDGLVIAKMQADDQANLLLYSPGGGANGARFQMMDKNTDVSDMLKLPGLNVDADRMFARKQFTLRRNITADTEIDDDESGFVFNVLSSSPVTITFKNTIQPGFFCRIYQLGSGTVTLAVESGGSITVFGGSAPIEMSGIRAGVIVDCVLNTSGTAADILLIGDAA